MPSERPLRRLVFKWTALRGLTAIALFIVIAFLIEYLMIYLFASSGLTDEFLMSQVLKVPGTAFSFTVTISPIFHLTPLGVITVLVTSWTYLTKYIAVVPRGISTPRKAQRIPGKRYGGRRMKRLERIRQWWRKAGEKLGKVGRRAKDAVRRTRGISYLSRRLSFAKATIRSATTIIVIFLASAFAMSILVYPGLIHYRVIGLFGSNPWFHEFVLNTLATAQAIGTALSPIASIDSALHAAAPGFRLALEGLGTAISEPLVRLDIVWKYMLCQNVAPWISAVVALAYGKYASLAYRRSKRR